MRKFFQGHAAFYGTVLVLAIFFQWLVSRAFDEEIRQADAAVQAVQDNYERTYNPPDGVLLTQLGLQINTIRQKLIDNSHKLQDQIAFSISPEYAFDPKTINSTLTAYMLREKRDRFNAKNEKKLKAFAQGKFQASFNSPSLDVSVERFGEYMLQMSIVEELFARLDPEGLLSSIESISTGIPRPEMPNPQVSGPRLVKKSARFPLTIDVNTDLATLDRLLAAIRKGKGYFFIEELEFQTETEVLKWSKNVRCKILLGALTLDLDTNPNY